MKRFNITQVIKTIIIVMYFVLAGKVVNAQVVYTLAKNTAVEIKVLGKSDADAMVIGTTGMEGRGDFKFNGETLNDINSLSFNLSAQNMEAKKAFHNKRVYKALYAANKPVISYNIKCATVIPTYDNNYGVILGGELTVGEVTQLKCMLLNATMNADSTITLTGNTRIQLINDNLKSVKFMQGPVQVDNDMDIRFTFVYKKDANQDTPADYKRDIMADYLTKL